MFWSPAHTATSTELAAHAPCIDIIAARKQDIDPIGRPCEQSVMACSVGVRSLAAVVQVRVLAGGFSSAGM